MTKVRNIGQTKQQLRDAPENAIFIWCDNNLGYPRQLAKTLKRADLTIVSPNYISTENNALRYSPIVIDHATVLTDRQETLINELNRHNGIINKKEMTLSQKGILVVKAPINNKDLNELHNALKQIEFLVVRAEYIFTMRRMKYEGYSPYFDKVERGQEMPEYELIGQHDTNGTIHYMTRIKIENPADNARDLDVGNW